MQNSAQRSRPTTPVGVIVRGIGAIALLLASITIFASAFGEIGRNRIGGGTDSNENSPRPTAKMDGNEATTVPSYSKAARLMASFTVFLLAVFVGVEVINKVPPTLHTPLMSGSNAISGITIIGAILAAGHKVGGLGAILGILATIFAMINVAGGFVVTDRMLKMFRKR